MKGLEGGPKSEKEEKTRAPRDGEKDINARESSSERREQAGEKQQETAQDFQRKNKEIARMRQENEKKEEKGKEQAQEDFDRELDLEFGGSDPKEKKKTPSETPGEDLSERSESTPEGKQENQEKKEIEKIQSDSQGLEEDLREGGVSDEEIEKFKKEIEKELDANPDLSEKEKARLKRAKMDDFAEKHLGELPSTASPNPNFNRVPGNAEVSNAYLNNVITTLPDGPRKELLQTAADELGVSEPNQKISEYHQAGGLNAGSGTAWCMSYVQWCLAKNGNPNAQRTAWARDGLNKGVDSTSNPQVGDLVVVARGSGGHIGFYLGNDPSGTPIILGGNQGKPGNVSVKKESRPLLGIRSVVT